MLRPYEGRECGSRDVGKMYLAPTRKKLFVGWEYRGAPMGILEGGFFDAREDGVGGFFDCEG